MGRSIKESREKLLGHGHRSWKGWRRAQIEGSGVGASGRIRRLRNQSRRKKNRRRGKCGSGEGRALGHLH